MSNIIDTTSLMTPSNFNFSGVNINDLCASEYTVVTIVVDISSSVASFKKQLEDCIKTVVGSCKSSPRSDNLLVRLVTFNQQVKEVHGFRSLDAIDVSEYDNCLKVGGSTALFNAVQATVEATCEYGKLLADQDYSVNGVVYIITDGEHNEGRSYSPTTIRDYIRQEARNENSLESLSVILIGVGYGNVSTYLDQFKSEAELTQFIDMEELFSRTSPEKALAKLAGYISKSISATSIALQSGNTTPLSSNILLF